MNLLVSELLSELQQFKQCIIRAREEKGPSPTPIPNSSSLTTEQPSMPTVSTISATSVVSVAPAYTLSEDVSSNSQLDYNVSAEESTISRQSTHTDRGVSDTTSTTLSRNSDTEIPLGNTYLQPGILTRYNQPPLNFLVPMALYNPDNRFSSATHLIYDPGGIRHIYDPGGGL